MILTEGMSTALLLVCCLTASTVSGHSEYRVGRTASAIKLPKSLSDLTATAADNGLIYIAGGCDSAFGQEYDVDDEKFTCRSVSNSFYSFNPQTQQFFTLPNMPEARYRHAAVVVNNQVWLVGGRDVYDRIVRSVHVYDITDQRWRTFNDLYAKFWVSDLGGFAYNGLAYFVGGFTQDYYAAPRVFSIDPVNSWETGSLFVVRHRNMWKSRGDIGVTVDLENEFAVVSGGSTHENDFCDALKSVEKYDLTTGDWEEIAPLHQARSGKAVVELNEQLIALGGGQQITKFCNGTSVELSGMQQPVYDVEMYDNGRWNIVDNVGDYHFRSASAVHDGKVYSFGGQSTYFKACLCHPAVDDILIYDLNDVGSSHHYDSGMPDTYQSDPAADAYQPTGALPTDDEADYTEFVIYEDDGDDHGDHHHDKGKTEFVMYEDDDSEGGSGGYKRQPVGSQKSSSTLWGPTVSMSALALVLIMSLF